MRRQARVFPGQDAALIRDKLPEQGDVLEVQRIEREVNFGLRTGGADFAVGGAAGGATPVRLFWSCFARHKGVT